MFIKAQLALFLACGMAAAQIDVLTANYDNNRTSANLSEHTLNTNNVNRTQFGRLFALPVDGQVYAQPLYVHALALPDNTTHNVVYVATMHNSVYAFDADTSGVPPLWQVNFGPTVNPASFTAPGATYTDILNEIGVLSTPVIDRAGGAIYVVNETLTGGQDAYYLHALDLATGHEKLGGPVEIHATVTGTGWLSGETMNGQLPFRPQDHLQRPGLLLANNLVYVAFGSHGDYVPWHGWIMAYQAGNIQQQTAVFCTTPSSAGAAIWQSGRGLAADSSGDLYVSTGNGIYDGIQAWGESVLHLTPLLTVDDWFTPADYATWTNDDTDFGSNGPILIPGTNLLVAGGKSGLIAVVNTGNMGHELDNDTGAVQTFTAVTTGQFDIFNSALWNRPDGPILYIWGYNDVLRAFRMTNGAFSATAASISSLAQTNLPFPGMTVSSNQFLPRSGILWATSGPGTAFPMLGTLHAYDASDVSRELWNSDMSPTREILGSLSKFANPTVANGKVYVPTDSQAVMVYGLLPVPGIQAVVNAASYSPSFVAPGELISIFGNHIGPTKPVGAVVTGGRIATSLGGVQVNFDGTPAPLLFVSAGQVNAVAPFAIAGKTSTEIRVLVNGASYGFEASVSAAAPAIFAADSSGAGQGAILNSDLSVNSPAHPAKRGSTVAIYATGTGTLLPAVPDGTIISLTSPPLTASPISVTIGGEAATVSYQGAAPGLVAGVMQINAEIPDNVTPGPSVPIVLTLASTQSLNTITLAVR